MVNNYPKYAAGVNFKKTDSNGVRHFYSAQVVADPSDETVESKLIKDGVVISEGGSSDFSTAEVTFANSNISDSPYQVKGIIRYREDAGMTDVYPIYVSNEEEQIINIPLYKGKATLNVEFINVDMSETPIITGGIAIDPATRYMIITGNGTFTAKSTD